MKWSYPKSEFPQVAFLGFEFLNLDNSEILELIENSLKDSGVAIHFVNAYTIAESERAHELSKILKTDILICDGRPLAFCLHWHRGFKGYIRGADFMRYILKNSSKEISHFFLGNTAQVLNSLVQESLDLNPDLSISGFSSPPFNLSERDLLNYCQKELVSKKVNVVWLSLGSPKQDFIAHYLAKSVNSVIICVGAAFDYISKERKEAPLFIRESGFEWLYRLAKEPRRLSKRYLIGNAFFVLRILRYLLMKR